MTEEVWDTPMHEAFDEIELLSEKDPISVDQAIIELKDAIETLGGKLTAEQERKHEQVMARRKRFGRRNELFPIRQRKRNQVAMIRAGVGVGRNTRSATSMRIERLRIDVQGELL